MVSLKPKPGGRGSLCDVSPIRGVDELGGAVFMRLKAPAERGDGAVC